MPPDLCIVHPDLSGAKALKCLCLLSHHPYLSTGEQLLREIYNLCFVQCTSVSVTEGALSLPKGEQVFWPCLKTKRVITVCVDL